MNTLLDYRNWCLSQKYPIMYDEALNYICQTINQRQYRYMLEIGTCVAYSTLYFSQNSLINHIESLERDLDRHLIARENVLLFNDKKIKLIYEDGLNYYPNKKYDLMLFDAAKAQNQAFLDHYLPYLNTNGIIFIDNIYFHDLKIDDDNVSLKTKSLIKKLHNFVENIQKDTRFNVKILSLGDGLMTIEHK